MKLEAARLLVDFSGFTLELEEDYRGRSLSAPCCGVVGQPGNFRMALAAFIADACDQGEDDCRVIAEAVRNLQEDGMGRERIWY